VTISFVNYKFETDDDYIPIKYVVSATEVENNKDKWVPLTKVFKGNEEHECWVCYKVIKGNKNV